MDEYRVALCEVATRRFAKKGYEGVTLRALAKDLGCSPMTPYRYFENKAQIFETVRRAAADRFADAIDRAVKTHDSHPDRLRAMCHSTVRFALDEPHAIESSSHSTAANALNRSRPRRLAVGSS